MPNKIEIVSPSGEPQKRKRGRPRKGEERPKEAAVPRVIMEGGTAVAGGVTPNWIADALDIHPTTARRRLAELDPIREKNGWKYYDLREAMSVFVEPRDGIGAYIARCKPGDLPENLRNEYWRTQHIKLELGKESDQLWASEDIKYMIARIAYEAMDHLKRFPSLVSDKAGVDYELVSPISDELVNSFGDSVRSIVDGNHVESILAQLDQEEKEIIRMRSSSGDLDDELRFDGDGDEDDT